MLAVQFPAQVSEVDIKLSVRGLIVGVVMVAETVQVLASVTVYVQLIPTQSPLILGIVAPEHDQEYE